MKIYTIGFTKRSARDFFETLSRSGAKRLLDVRTNNRSQLAGFSKRDDLEYFLSRICVMEYFEEKSLAPRNESLKAYRAQEVTWAEYADQYLRDLSIRGVQHSLSRGHVSDSVLLCSEDKPHNCHRRLAAEYLMKSWGDVEVIHL